MLCIFVKHIIIPDHHLYHNNIVFYLFNKFWDELSPYNLKYWYY